MLIVPKLNRSHILVNILQRKHTELYFIFCYDFSGAFSKSNDFLKKYFKMNKIGLEYFKY